MLEVSARVADLLFNNGLSRSSEALLQALRSPQSGLFNTVFDTKQFISALQQIAEEKGIPEDKVVETIEAAIAAAYKKDYGEKGQIVKAKFNKETADFTVTQIKFVIEGVDENGYVIGELPESSIKEDEKAKEPEFFRNSRSQEQEQPPVSEETEEDLGVKFNPEKFITLDDAEKLQPGAKIGDEIIIPLESKMEFGRIAAQTAKQVVIQRLREVEREAIFAEFKGKEGDVISGLVQRIEGRMVYIDLGRTSGVLTPAEQLPQDTYRIGQRLRFYLVRVDESAKGPMILLSRSNPKFILKLFEFEVPEIESGSVEVKAIAREPGSRSKIAVISKEQGVDPIGSLVGQKGVRVQTVINELGGEKIDIIEWNEDPEKFIANALSPAKVIQIKVLDERYKHALAEVADDQFSLAIGKNGQNVRLAAKLTGWKIDVRAPQAVLLAEKEEDATVTDEAPASEETPATPAEDKPVTEEAPS